MPDTRAFELRCLVHRVLALAPLALVALTGLLGCTDNRADPDRSGTEPLSPLRVGSVMGGDGADLSGYARAFEPRDFSFPTDHGPHPGFQSEWWYFVGNLDAPGVAGGRRFGFQLTFFRFAVAPEPRADAPERASPWASRQMWMAHFAVSDIDGGRHGERFHAFERFRRGAMGLAGATSGEAESFRVWLDDWSATGLEPGSLLPLRLQAVATRDGEDVAAPADSRAQVALDLVLSEGKNLVLQGDRGLSQKGPEPGNASYYYSQTRMPARGTVTLASDRFEVHGTAWMDREWSTSALGKDEVGWDWFSLQLTDTEGEPWELMLYQIRREDGTAAPHSEGLWVAPDGAGQRVSWREANVEVLDRWRSPDSGAVYPAGWRLRLPGQELDLTVQPLLADQELDVSFRYWEGAVEVTGSRAREPVSGRGYVELTGYGEEP